MSTLKVTTKSPKVSGKLNVTDFIGKMIMLDGQKLVNNTSFVYPNCRYNKQLKAPVYALDISGICTA